MDGFNGILDIEKEDDETQINRWKRIIGILKKLIREGKRIVGILKKLIREGKDSKKIRQIL